jgi:periplasmic protein TonB
MPGQPPLVRGQANDTAAGTAPRLRGGFPLAVLGSLLLHGTALLFLAKAPLPSARAEHSVRIAVELVAPATTPPPTLASEPLASTASRARGRVVRDRSKVATVTRPVAPVQRITVPSPPPEEKLEAVEVGEAMVPPPAPVAPAKPVRIATTSSATSVVGVRAPAGTSSGRDGRHAVTQIENRLRWATPGCYPYAAIRANLEGVARLSFCVGEAGMAEHVRIVQSSGSNLLDDATVDCIVPTASPFPGTKDLCVLVPVRFQLRP